MTAEQLVDQTIQSIEEGELRAELALMSTTQTILMLLEENRDVRTVRRLDPELAHRFLERATAIYESPAPEGYAHPRDLSLAAHLFLVARMLPPGAQPFVDRVAREARPEFAAASTVAG